jgi:hypothetical protein
MHVPQLLRAFVRAPNVEVVKAGLPECSPGFIAKDSTLAGIGAFSLGQQRVRGPLLEHLHHGRRITHFWLGDQEVNVLGHHHVADDYEPVLLSGLFENGEKRVARAGCVEQRQTVIAGVRDEVQMVRTVRTMQAGRHDNLMLPAASYPPLQKTQGRGTRGFESGKKNPARCEGRTG